MTVLEALKRIYVEYNVDILVEGDRVCSYLHDLIPNERRIFRRIKVAYESGAVKMLSKSNDEHCTLFKRACLKMEEFSDMQPYASAETMAFFFDVLGLKYRIENVQQCNKENDINQKDANQLIPDSSNIVVDIGGSGARIGIVTRLGIVSIQRETINSIDELVNAIKSRAVRITGIAIAVPGFVQGDSGRVLLSRNAPYLEGNLCDELKGFFPEAEIYVINDGEAHALALLSLPNIELGAINIAIGTSVGFGIISEMGQVIRTLSGQNFDIGDLWLRTHASDAHAWWALGESGLEELERTFGDDAYKHLGASLGYFATQLAIIFRPKTIGFSGGIASRYWNKIETAIKAEFNPPILSPTQIVGQKDAEPALVGLSMLFRKK